MDKCVLLSSDGEAHIITSEILLSGGFSLSNISFGCVKETSQGDVSLTHPKHMFDIVI